MNYLGYHLITPDAFLSWIPVIPFVTLETVYLAAMVYGWWETE